MKRTLKGILDEGLYGKLARVPNEKTRREERRRIEERRIEGINQALLEIYNDHKLREAINQQGDHLFFAKTPRNGLYNCYMGLVLRPERWMRVERYESWYSPCDDPDAEGPIIHDVSINSQGKLYIVYGHRRGKELARDIKGYDGPQIIKSLKSAIRRRVVSSWLPFR